MTTTSDSTRVSENEVLLVDPQTGGTWRVVAHFPISEVAALWAVTVFMKRENARPSKGATLTIVFSIRVAQEGEIPSQL